MFVIQHRRKKQGQHRKRFLANSEDGLTLKTLPYAYTFKTVFGAKEFLNKYIAYGEYYYDVVRV